MTKAIYKYSESIEQHIFFIRGMRVILDSDLSAIYGVKTKVLNQAVKRNKERFPADFAFRLNQEELTAINNQAGMWSQIVTAFIRLRETLALHKDLAQKLLELEQKVQSHDAELQAIVQALRQLMDPPEKPKRSIGFHVKEPIARYIARKKPK